MEQQQTNSIRDYFSLDSPTGTAELSKKTVDLHKKAEVVTAGAAPGSDFTLLELIIVIVITGIIAGIAIPVFL